MPVLPFPNRNEPTEEDIVVLMRASIRLYYKRAIRNSRDCDIILAVRE